MQPAGELVMLVIEFPARVQAGQNEFDARNFFLRVNIDRHATAIVADFDGAILVHRHFDFLAVAGERLVDTVVDDFVGEMVWPGRIRIHARPAPHGLKAAQDLDIGRIVPLAHLQVPK